ncbi:hypothetical protein M405DRAFT_923809 [Rhizopogon salebrosus TDB-379]|nr:hypothetical protein M405DRAFT_923809 [Rhizopogon salebrosus TDB-379]
MYRGSYVHPTLQQNFHWAHRAKPRRVALPSMRLNVPRINAPPPSATLPMVSSSNSTPLPPRTRLKSSTTGGPQPPKQSSQNRTSSNNLPPDLPSPSELSAASDSQLRKSNSKLRARAPQSPSSSTSTNANATLPSTPRHLGKLKGSQRSSNLPPSSNSTRPSHSQDDNVPPTLNQQGNMKQSPAQSTPCPQPRNVNKFTVLEAERLAILETERRDADLSRAAARLRDVEAATKFLCEKQARLGDEAEQEELTVSRRRLGPERKRRMQIWGGLLLPSGKYVRAERRRVNTAKVEEYQRLRPKLPMDQTIIRVPLRRRFSFCF